MRIDALSNRKLQKDQVESLTQAPKARCLMVRMAPKASRITPTNAKAKATAACERANEADVEAEDRGHRDWAMWWWACGASVDGTLVRSLRGLLAT